MTDKKLAKQLASEMQRRQIQKDFLAREQVLDKETGKRLKAKWFEILLSSKLPEMKDNLRNVLDYMEKLVEIEIHQKRLFEEGRVEASKQLNTQVQSHSRALDNLYDLYLQRIHDLHGIYLEKVKKNKEKAEREFEEMAARSEKHKEDLKAILFQMEKNQEKKEDLMKCDMFLQTDDEKCRIAEKTENLRIRLERVMEKIWNQITSTLVEYQQSTEDRRNHHAQLKARDEKDSMIISSQMKKTQKLIDQIQQLKADLENTSSTDEKSILISDYREERAKFYNSFLYLKKLLAEEMRMDDIHLKKLTALSKDTMDYLNHFVKKGEKIVTLFSVCRKLETEKEKVVPVGRTLYSKKIPQNLMHQLNIASTHPPPLNFDTNTVSSSMHIPVLEHTGPWKNPLATICEALYMHQYPILQEFQYFWQKVGKVKMSIYALSHNITNLKAENESLKKLLNSYFSRISVQN